MSSMSAIQDFLAQKRIAVIGVSRDPKDISRSLLKEFRSRGYEALAVNPALAEADGTPCYAHVRDIEPPVDTALLMTPANVTEEVVRECADAKVKHVWMYRAGTTGGAVSEDAVRFCESQGMSVIPGECPYMFLPKAGCVHWMHGFIRKITGKYPR